MTKNPTLGPVNSLELRKIQQEIVNLESIKQDLKNSIDNYQRLFSDSGYRITTSASEIREDEEDLERKFMELSSVTE